MFRLGGLPLLLLLLYQLAVQAVDAPGDLVEPATCADGCSKRSLYNIIWGCVSTTIICAWAAVHANIPPREGPVKRVFRKVEMMFWAIVTPEFLPTWALNQRQAATTIRDLYNEKVYGPETKSDQKVIPKILTTLKTFFSFYGATEAPSYAWTRKHGHFLIMGGFHLIEPVERETIVPSTLQMVEEGRAPADDVKEGRVTILTFEMLRVLLDDQNFRDRIRITAEEIADKSKGDELAKFILVLQALWFICQCVARHYQNLTLTQLELTTLALASLNGITLWLWKDKPLGVETPIRVYVDNLSDKERAIEGRGNSERSKFLELFRPTKDRNPFLLLLLSPLIILALLVLPITNAFKSTLSDILITSRSFPADAKHVPTFYVPEYGYSKKRLTSFLLVFATIFGAIHIAGWNLPFPTEAERKLWRIASIAVACLPIATLAVLFMVSYLITLCRAPPNLTKVLDYSTDPMLAYVVARLMLLGLAVALLRHQPPSAFIAVDWAKFYPHFL